MSKESNIKKLEYFSPFSTERTFNASEYTGIHTVIYRSDTEIDKDEIELSGGIIDKVDKQEEDWETNTYIIFHCKTKKEFISACLNKNIDILWRDEDIKKLDSMKYKVGDKIKVYKIASICVFHGYIGYLLEYGDKYYFLDEDRIEELNESVGNTEDNLTSSQKEVLSFIDKQIKTAQVFAQQPKGSVPSYMRQNMNGRVTGRLETLWRNRDYDTFNLALDKIKEAGVIFSKTNSIWERHKNTPMEDLYPSPEFKMAMKIIDGLKQNMTIDKDNIKWAIEHHINKLATENRVRSLQVVVKSLKEKQENEELNLFPSDSWIWRYLKDDDEVVKQDNPESGVIYEADGCTVEDNIELSRVQISFPGKPSGEIISYLKQHGFRWSPSNMSWQRQNTPEGRRQALDFARKFFPDEIKKEDEIEVKEEKGVIEETSAVEEINTPSGDESSLFDFAFLLSKKIENEKVTWVDAQKFASEMNVKASRQELIQACEMAVVMAARRIASTDDTIRAKYEQIRDLYDNQPTIAPKDGESRFLQQFSTPAPLAFMAGEFVKANKNVDKYGSSYLEPSAGNGMLTIALDPLKTTVNEIDKIRYNNLVKLHYINVKNYDAASEEFTNEIGTNFTGIITNPPFADLEKNKYLTKIGKKGEREIEYTFSKLDHKLAIMALDKMADNGRAAIIVGGKLGAKMYGLRNSYWNRMDRLFGEYAIFIAYLHRQYNIVDILYISGDLYAKQGTTYPIIMILIDGRKKWDSRPECVWRKYDPEKDKEIMSFTEYFNRIYPHIEEQQTQATSEEDKERKLRLAKAKAKSLLLYAYAQKNKESKKEKDQDWLDSINADELRERLKQDNGEGEKLLQEAKRQL